jgi:hypothetical protein
VLATASLIRGDGEDHQFTRTCRTLIGIPTTKSIIRNEPLLRALGSRFPPAFHERRGARPASGSARRMAEAYQLGSALEALTGADLAYQRR